MPNPLRAVALLLGLAFLGTFVSVFYHIVDIVGGVTVLLGVVAAALLLATVSARWLPVRTAGVLGLGLLLGGGGVYFWSVSSSYRVLTVDLVVGQFTYLTGTSVLQFTRVDVWAIALAPAPVFLTWYLLLRRQYDLGALTGGMTLGYFVLTGDASGSTTVLGMVSGLGMLGVGALERAGGTWEQVERLGLLLVVATLVSRAVRDIATFEGVLDGGESGGTGGSGKRTGTVESSLTESDRRVRVFDELTLSPKRRFTVTSNEPAYWHVASYDRYTGEEWVLTGDRSAYRKPLAPPPGKTVAVEQTFVVEEAIETMPAAWKPVQVVGAAADDTRVSPTGGLVPARGFDAADEYTVVSRVPDVSLEQLRTAGTSYPDRIRERYLQLPESTPTRVARKAREITSDTTTPYDAARAIEEWLEANKTYSLTVDRLDEDVADAFIFEMNRGYCVYYATAMTVLLRALDIPARFTHGYLPGEQVEADTWIVRGLDSHAWTEVYFPDAGWIPFDPTPSGPREAAERARLEEAQLADVNRVASEEERQSGSTPSPDTPAGIRRVSSPTPTNSTTESPTPTSAPDSETDTPTPTPVGSSGAPGPGDRLSTRISRMDRLTLLGTVAGIALGVRRLELVERGYRAVWLRWQPRTDSPREDVERAYKRLEHLLAQRHRPRKTGETPRQYLDALEGVIDSRAHRVRQFYERAHYQGQITRDEADEAVRLVDELVSNRD